VDDNVWEYPFGELDDDDDIFYRKPVTIGVQTAAPVEKSKAFFSLLPVLKTNAF
jgi:hypothetical protein